MRLYVMDVGMYSKQMCMKMCRSGCGCDEGMYM